MQGAFDDTEEQCTQAEHSVKTAEEDLRKREFAALEKLQRLLEKLEQCNDAWQEEKLRGEFVFLKNRNKRIVEAIELQNRSNTIDLLRKNMNLLQQEFSI